MWRVWTKCQEGECNKKLTIYVNLDGEMWWVAGLAAGSISDVVHCHELLQYLWLLLQYVANNFVVFLVRVFGIILIHVYSSFSCVIFLDCLFPVVIRASPFLIPGRKRLLWKLRGETVVISWQSGFLVSHCKVPDQIQLILWEWWWEYSSRKLWSVSLIITTYYLELSLIQTLLIFGV